MASHFAFMLSLTQLHSTSIRHNVKSDKNEKLETERELFVILYFLSLLSSRVFPFSLFMCPALRSFSSCARKELLTAIKVLKVERSRREKRTTIFLYLKQFAIDEPIVVAAEWKTNRC